MSKSEIFWAVMNITSIVCLFYFGAKMLVKIGETRGVITNRNKVIRNTPFGGVAVCMMHILPQPFFDLLKDLSAETKGKHDPDDLLDLVVLSVSHAVVTPRSGEAFHLRLFSELSSALEDHGVSRDWLWNRLCQWTRQEAIRQKAIVLEHIPAGADRDVAVQHLDRVMQGVGDPADAMTTGTN